MSPAVPAWILLSTSGPVPSARARMGFCATPDGLIYVFGGNSNGERKGNLRVRTHANTHSRARAHINMLEDVIAGCFDLLMLSKSSRFS